MGIPYYTSSDFNTTPHYTPIPEQCASWIRKRPAYCNFNEYYEQIKTGTKVYFHGHEYVELFSRYYDVHGAYLQTDSLIGYFRNDTAGQKVYFTNSMTSADLLLYDFSLPANSYSTGLGYPFNYGVALSSSPIGGFNRVQWDYIEYDNPTYVNTLFRHRSYMEGIGGLQGFVLVHDAYNQANSGELISFCVCGQSIYPNSNPANCFEITGLQDLLKQSLSATLYPNPTSDLFHLSFSGAGRNTAHLILTDLLGQQVYSSPISDPETTHDISKLPSGIYTWRLVSDNAILKTGKVVKQ